MASERILSFHVNGEPARRLVPGARTLLETLRDDLGLPGTKHGCDVGDCGACTVLVDGVARLSCITLAMDVDGSDVRTIEGVGPAEERLIAAFHAHGAAQCGYCTPGIVMSLVGLLADDPRPDEASIRHCLGSNICRCTGYDAIVAAAVEATR
jgi:carbon-monoxide dehydrogenase small subunit